MSGRPKAREWQALRRAVFERDGEMCVMCRLYKATQIDHIIPLSLGGPSELANLQAVCHFCNAKKATYLDTDNLNWSQLHTAKAALLGRIAYLQARIDGIEKLTREFEPLMKHDPWMRVGQARKLTVIAEAQRITVQELLSRERAS